MDTRSSDQSVIDRLLIAFLILIATCAASCSNQSGGEATEGPRLLRDAGTEGCPHPLLPLISGARWTYELGEKAASQKTSAELRVMEITSKGKALFAKVKRAVGGSTTTVEATCNSEGTSFLSLFVPLGPPLPAKLNFAPRITKRTGAMIPGLEGLRPAKTWEYELIAHTEQPGGKALTLDSNWTVKGRFLADREVTVPAGRYKAKQFELTVTGHHRPPEEEDITFSDRIMDPPPMQFTYSLAAGVGVVLIEGKLLGVESTRRSRWALTKVDLVGSSQE